MTSTLIRQQFLDFFESKFHTIVPSAPIVTKGDPTLMFNNSGMSQFKEYFLGNVQPKSNRIADTQKCLRVSGKHNDLEQVGIDTYHHTMFEMLGNWSFGDYFKKEAIHWAWELLTEVYKIPKDILFVSVFEGNPSDNIPFDQETWDIWASLIGEDKIILGNKKDNFWEMGEQGPCGPCTEIHVDIRTDEEKQLISGKSLVNNDHPQVVEIWNIVFMEFNRKANGSLEKLPAKHVDTGMGFERLCMVLQNVKSNYDTDIFLPIINKIENISHSKYTPINQNESEEKINIAIRVIADHFRAVAFAIADGQIPSNTGAGYVIRRILRRAIRYGFTFLNIKMPFIYQLTEVLSNQMGTFFPELISQKALIINVIKEEEHSFLRTLEHGLQRLDTIIEKSNGILIDGNKAFELYDTYGFPIDLTALILREKGLKLDDVGFDNAMLEQKKRSKMASEILTDDWKILIHGNVEQFVGYDKMENDVKITRIRKIISKKDGVLYQIVLDATPFYPEGGGQVGDKGFLISSQNMTSGNKEHESIEIINTIKENNIILHLTKQLPENLSASFVAKVNSDLRQLSSRNHTATHLLHQALRSILGTHVEQKGSFVNPTYLRFDFSHFNKLTNDDLQHIEIFVNEKIQESISLKEYRDIPISQAVKAGAMALFGEKYGETVRMIEFDKSKELCGGIHVKNTAEIWHFKITSESAVAAGIRRIEAITSDAVKSHFALQENTLNELKLTLKNPQNILKAINSLKDDNAKLTHQIEGLIKEKIKNLSTLLSTEIKEINGIKFLSKQVDLSPTEVKNLAYEMGNKGQDFFIILATIYDNKPLISCYISKELVQSRNFNANIIVKELGKYIDGSGGGQPFFATTAGKKVEGIKQAIDKGIDFLQNP